MAMDSAHGAQSEGLTAAHLSLKGCEALGGGAGVGWESSEEQPVPGSCRATERPRLGIRQAAAQAVGGMMAFYLARGSQPHTPCCWVK